MIIQNGSKVLLIGDSITDADRAKPAGEGLFGALGRGYVSLIEALLTSGYPAAGLRIVNQGTSGNTTRDLKVRWQKDVLDHQPDWLSIMIGTNDVWRQFDTPLQKEWCVGPEEYEANLEELIAAAQPTLRGGLILMTPFYIEPNRSDAMRARMDEYGAIVKKLAEKHHAIFVDVQAAFDHVLKDLYPATLAWDRVHPNQAGHMIIARAFLNAIGFAW